MGAKLVQTACIGVLLVLGAPTYAGAQAPHRSHAHHVDAHRVHAHLYAHRSGGPLADPAAAAMRPYQAYVYDGQVYDGQAYGHVPHDPLIPLKQEIPPPVDPNEPASGSYGAMLEGRNPAPSEP